MASSIASPRPRLEHLELERFLWALRLQLWWRDALVICAASASVGALAGALVLLWPARPAWLTDSPSLAVWVMLAALGAGLLVSATRRPSIFHAARVADRQLGTASRLATAAEVLDGQHSSSLGAAQLEDAWRLARAIQPLHAYPRHWRTVQAALGVAGISAVLLGLSLAGVFTPVGLGGLVGESAASGVTAAEDATQAADAAARSDDASALSTDQSANPAAAAQTLEDLQAAAAQSQATEAALQKLADALRGTAAARDVGEALRRGDYEDASNRLMALGRDADQLSRISKRELASAMQRAAFDSAKLDPPLALAENAVQRALTRQVYAETRTALENLARTVTDVKKGVVSQEALAKSLDQLNQQQATPGGAGGEDPEGYIADIPGEEPKQVGLVKGATSTIQVPGPEGDPRTATRSSAGLNPGGDPLGDLTSRLNVPPVDVSVEALLANDRGRDNANPAAPTVKISDTNQNGVRPSGVVQPGDPVQDVAEQTVEPTADREAVRAYFKSSGDAPATP